MLTLEQFDQLSRQPLSKRSVALQWIGGEMGEQMQAWKTALPRLPKQQQYEQIKTLLSELAVADLPMERRFALLESLTAVVERLIVQMQNEYIHRPQAFANEQITIVGEVRSLYFLLLIAYQALAFDADELFGKDSSDQQKITQWLKKITDSFGKNSDSIMQGAAVEGRAIYILSVYRVMIFGYALLMEFSLSYQKTPNTLWRILNHWYLKTLRLQVESLCVSKLGDFLPGTIHKKYVQNCLASFVNLFAYRRRDIVQIFRILPTWVEYIKTTLTAHAHLRMFVNLQGDTPPEAITPYASINPYSAKQVCLFFDMSTLFEYLASLQSGAVVDVKDGSIFESRFAKMMLLSFDKQKDEDMKACHQSAEVLVGYGAIFEALAQGRSFSTIISQSELASNDYLPKRLLTANDNQKQPVSLVGRSFVAVRFVLKAAQSDDNQQSERLNRPYLPVFSIFAIKPKNPIHPHPWRLGIVHWAGTEDNHVAVDGRFLGRILLVCGVRLSSHDMRSKDFVQAMLLSGDELNQQTTLILPRYHFKVGDRVIMRVEEKETLLRLEQNLLTTDEIEQYEIVRLAV